MEQICIFLLAILCGHLRFHSDHRFCFGLSNMANDFDLQIRPERQCYPEHPFTQLEYSKRIVSVVHQTPTLLNVLFIPH